MNPDPTIVEPDEMVTLSGDQVARWGQVGVVKMGDPCDPIPSVYASDHGGGEVEFGGEFRMSLDEAEQVAARIANAVRWQRARNADKRAAELNAMATGLAATHDWRPRQGRSTRCVLCRTVVSADELLVAGVVPACGEQCSLGWHEIYRALSGEDGDASCIFCKASYTATDLYVLIDANGDILAVGPFLTRDQAAQVSEVADVEDLRYVPVKRSREAAHAAVTQAREAADARRRELDAKLLGGGR